MAEKKKILYMVEAMGGGVFTYIVDLANELVDTYDMYIAYAVRKQVVENPMIGAIPSRNEVQRELDDLLMSM